MAQCSDQATHAAGFMERLLPGRSRSPPCHPQARATTWFRGPSAGGRTALSVAGGKELVVQRKPPVAGRRV